MAFTGDLEQLHIVDIIQLLHTTRKSGTFSIKGNKGESRIIFGNGYIVSATHLNKIRIGAVLVQMKVITQKDLEQALAVQKKAGKNRKPLVATLIELGKLGHDEAFRGLRKLIEMTVVELIGWTSGTFTLDTEALEVSPECKYPISKMEHEISLDAQMVLMDALRIFDERERDRNAGKDVISDEELYPDVIAYEEPSGSSKKPVITADDLGLGELDHLERIIPQFTPVTEIFHPLQIHRQKIKETLADFPEEEQETFVAFLEKSSISRDARDSSQRHEGRTMALVLFSEDELIKYAIMTICKDEGVLVFATGEEKELECIISQCLAIKALPLLVFDNPQPAGTSASAEKITGLRHRMRDIYPNVSTIQMSSPFDYAFTLQSLHEGVRAVLPRPVRGERKERFIKDIIQFLEIFKAYVKNLFLELAGGSDRDSQLGVLRNSIREIREMKEPSGVMLALLQHVSGICERSAAFIVRPTELAGERAIGLFDEKSAGPTSVKNLKIPLSEPSIFRNAVEKGSAFYGESSDEVLKKHIFEVAGEPAGPSVLLLPVKSRGKTVTLIYGDFGLKEPSSLQIALLEVLADTAGVVLENGLYRKQADKASLK